MQLKFLQLILFLCIARFAEAQHACTVTSCPLPDENIDSIRLEMAKQIKIEPQYGKSELKAITIRVENNRYGYQIMADDKMILEEKSIPAISGYYGFINEEEAMRVAEFAIKKIREGEMPPSITVTDLEEMKISL